MIDGGHLLIAVTSKNDLLPPRGSNIYRSGIRDGERGYEIFAHPSSVHPSLLLINPISDDNGNIIMPGYYELVLSADREMLYIVQSGVQLASFPVFKLEEDKDEASTPPMDNKSLRKYNKEKKKKEKDTKRAICQGKIPEALSEYSNASIQYDEEGGYYLIKYERGRIKAWGAIKQ